MDFTSNSTYSFEDWFSVNHDVIFDYVDNSGMSQDLNYAEELEALLQEQYSIYVEALPNEVVDYIWVSK